MRMTCRLGALGSSAAGDASDHWHRTEKDRGRPYAFKDAEALIDDFFDEVERVLCGRGVGLRVTRVEESRRLK